MSEHPVRLIPPAPAASLTLREWQVWHTYASFFDSSLPALGDLARRLVANGVAECAVTSDGDAWWAADDVSVDETGRPQEPSGGPPDRSDRRPVATGRVEVALGPDRIHSALRLPPGLAGHAYATEGLLNWAWARHAELRLFGDGPLPPRYVWAQLGACTFTAVVPERRRLVLYPQLKIFETGVVLVHLRMFSPERPMRVEEFIPEYLNAALAGYRWVHVPPGIAAWAPAAAPQPGAHRWFRRPWTAYRQWYHQRAIARKAEVEVGGDFAFRQISLGLAQDAELARRTTEAAEPEIQRRSRDVLLAEAAARGVHLSPDLKTITLDPGVTLTMDGVALETERVGEDVPGVGAPRAAQDTVPPRVVDLTEIYEATARAGHAEAQRLGHTLAVQQVYAPGREPETFRGLALTIMGVAGVVAGTDRRGPRRGLALALLGAGGPRGVGAHWTGRPHTHLLRFAGQSPSAAENARQFAADLGRVMLRAAVANSTFAARQLPPTTRSFDDHGAYLAVQGTLWVYTSVRPGAPTMLQGAGQMPRGNGTARVEFVPAPAPAWAPTPTISPPGGTSSGDVGVGETNVGRVGADRVVGVSLRPGAERPMQTFEHQTKVEMLEYAYMLHRRIADGATRGADQRPGRAAEALLAAQRDLADFEWALQDTGRYGEVREQLEAGLVAYGVPKLRERVAGLLRVRQEAALYRGGADSRALGGIRRAGRGGARCPAAHGRCGQAGLAPPRPAAAGA